MRPSLNEILLSALDAAKIKHEDWEILRCCRLANVIHAKRIASLVASQYGYKPTEIARILGVDRTTVLYHIKCLKEFYALYQDAKEMVDAVRCDLEKRMGQEVEHIIESWIARNSNGLLIVSPKKPESMGGFWLAEGARPFSPQTAFPQITHDVGPVKVRIKVTIENETM